MLIKFLHSVAGDDFSYGKGREIDLPDNIARSYIRTDNAVAVSNISDQPRRRPIVSMPEVHATIIKKPRKKR